MIKQFYIYVQCRPSGEPFYVGKGCGRRAYIFKSSDNPHYHNVVKKYGKVNLLVFIRRCDCQWQAFRHEIWMIAWCRAQGFKLCNKTDGGKGVSGYGASMKQRIQTSERNRLQWQDPVYRARQVALRKIELANPERRRQIGCVSSVIMKANWADSEIRKAMIVSIVNSWKNPERLKEVSERTSAWWASPAGITRKLRMKSLRRNAT